MPATEDNKKLAEAIWGDVEEDTRKKVNPPQDKIILKKEDKEEEDKKEEIKFKLKEEDKEEDKKEEKPKDDFEIPTDEEIEELEEEEEKLDQKTKPGQLAALRKQRDEAREEIETLQARVKELESSGSLPEDLKEKIGDKGLSEIAKENVELKARLDEFEKEQDGLKSKLREVSIENDPDFVQNYNQPIVDALDGLDAVVAEVDDEGNIINPDYINKLKYKIFNFKEAGVPVSSAREVKAILKAFANEYQEATGENYDLPDPGDVMKSVRKLVSLASKRDEAKQEWEKERENAKTSSLKERQQKEEERQEVLRKERVKNVQETIQEFDYSKFSKLGSKKEIKDLIIEASDELEKIITDSSSQPSWKEVIEARVKAKSFDRLLSLYLENAPEDEDDSHHGTADKIDLSKTKKNEDSEVDWLGNILDKPINRPAQKLS
jgi:hypothetical protein